MPHTNDNDSPKRSIDEALRQYGEEARFSPSFASRLEERVFARPKGFATKSASPLDALMQEIIALFPRFALASLLLSAALTLYNVQSNSESIAEWTFEAALGINFDATELIID